MSEAPRERSKKRKNPQNNRVRPNPLRQALLVGVAIAGLAAGYLLAGLFDGDKPAQRMAEYDAPSQHSASGEPEPWYRSQSPPPEMVTAPDLPLFPDPMDEQDASHPPRAYEEALPQEVYETPLVSLPMPPPPHKPPVASPVEIVPPTPPAEAPALKAAPVQPPPAAAPADVAATSPPPWRRFAVRAPVVAGKPRIALVIDDMGVDRKRSAQVIALEGPLTLSFLTYANGLAEQTAAARAAGHELLLHVTMEPGSKAVDPGPNVLLTSHSPEEVLRRLRWGMGRFQSFVGVNNHMGSKFTESTAGMSVVMRELKRRGLLFLDSRTSSKTIGPAMARLFRVPYAERNIFLDNVNDEAAVYARLTETEALARRQGYAIAIGHPRDATLGILPRWIKEIKELGFQMVPLSSLIAEPETSG